MSMARVLVVDDDPDIRDFVLFALSDEGHDVAVAPNGLVGLKMAAEYAPQLVLLDYNMPHCDARCFLNDYRDWPEPLPPVVLVTAAHDARRLAKECGLEHFIGKPFDLAVLLDVVERYAA
jgi:two-component system, OmpR family, KDP operon response regulator KdpE